MRLFGKKRFTLRVHTGEREHVLLPGDKLVLTHEGEGTTGSTKFKASVTWKYVWDGRTLKKVWE